ncbi:MAG: hypothetical protein R3F24_05520 [Gammaproteobacteria bacterium]
MSVSRLAVQRRWRMRCHSIAQARPAYSRPARVDAYPVTEQWGLVWAFLGDLPESRRPPLPDFFPEYDAPRDGSWRFVHGQAQFDCNWVRAIENGVDRSHAVFVHEDFGNPQDPVVRDYQVEQRENVLYSANIRVPLNKRGAWRDVIPDERSERKTEVQIFLPAPTIRIQMHMQPPVTQIIVTAYTPVDAYHTRMHFIHARNFYTEEQHDADALRRVLLVFGEDAAVINHLQPALVPRLLSDELLLQGDKHGTLFRRHVKAAEAAGDAIDHRAMQQEDDCARVIPCPRRREDPSNWILRPVLMQPAAAEVSAETAVSATGA